MSDSSPRLPEIIVRLRDLVAEAETVLGHFEAHPTVVAEAYTVHDAYWIARYDAAMAEFERLGML